MQPATTTICGAMALLVAGSCAIPDRAAAATHRHRPVLVQVAVTGNGDVRYSYMGHRIGDAELDRLCRDGIARKSPVTFHKAGGGGDPMKLILAKAQCLGAGARKSQAASTALHTHAKPRHTATPPR